MTGLLEAFVQPALDAARPQRYGQVIQMVGMSIEVSGVHAAIGDGGLEQDRVADGSPPQLHAGLGVEADDLAGRGADEQLAVDNGGVKQPSSTQTTVKGLTNETHRIDVFYLDRYPVHALMDLDANADFQP